MMKTQRAKKMQYLYSCILMVFLLTLSSPSWAQKRTISGIVTDETNEPVIGANVVIKNTTVGTITGIDGQYRIEAPDNAILVFSFIGYNSIEEKVNGRTQINVSMKSNDITLSGSCGIWCTEKSKPYRCNSRSEKYRPIENKK